MGVARFAIIGGRLDCIGIVAETDANQGVLRDNMERFTPNGEPAAC